MLNLHTLNIQSPGEHDRHLMAQDATQSIPGNLPNYKGIALMRVFPKPIVLTTNPRIDVYVLFTSKWDLLVKTIALGKTRISAISVPSTLMWDQHSDGKTKMSSSSINGAYDEISKWRKNTFLIPYDKIGRESIEGRMIQRCLGNSWRISPPDTVLQKFLQILLCPVKLTRL